ncbi:hypothetical protein [Paraburkholderia sp. PGU16]|jgi:hypothetical protein|uniref:Lipoprotein n=1 Tax=Paraburkholderia largidicola TaxID=3014751 RepID=A0A7I8BYT3_9BURK|nr:hypothetical protein [Paraburkholderia sp. PGU16]BCF93892.1 hypothetical protein PPGU16_69590 [Paraburkholderia sp. PGU16]BEU27071.1 hypothetical protein PBP221_72110 [Paraburkholderia sp. 22B1P]GJH32198.1 hypothetical protein CBA19CS91_05595 [Paraburkholderia hospita]
MTSRCRARLAVAAFACVAVIPLAALAADPAGDKAQGAPPGGNDYPTQGRVEYVLGCMDDNGHDFANVYKCSCVIDKIAAALPYDEYVEQMTFAKYATLGGEGGNEFRVDRARAQTKKYRALQQEAYQACGLAKATPSAAK